jgi:hypothetical protein
VKPEAFGTISVSDQREIEMKKSLWAKLVEAFK